MSGLSQRLARLALTIAITLQGAAPLIVGVHLSSTAHHFCEEHGTLEHDRCDGDCHEPTLALPVDPSANGVSSSAGLPETPHRHRFCHHGSTATPKAIGLQPVAGAETTDDVTATAGPRARERAHSLVALDQAPKNSPPSIIS